MDLFRKILRLEYGRTVVGLSNYEETLVIHITINTRR
jgi:hypothetical protein